MASVFGKAVLRECDRRPAAKPMAILVESVTDAAGFCARLREAGLRVPRDISVAAAAGAASDPPWNGQTITCSAMRFREMGMEAVRQLQRRCGAAQPTAPNVIRIGFDFRARHHGAAGDPPHTPIAAPLASPAVTRA